VARVVRDLAPSPALSERVAAIWTRNGLLEHASIASFARFSLQLLAIGAPMDLVRRAHQAATEEVTHAELCFGLASSCGDADVTADKLPLGGDVLGSLDLGDLAVAAFEEGCVGETLGAIEASVAAGLATHPRFKSALARIADDEARHAELAWLFVRWALATGGASVRDKLGKAIASSSRPSGSPPPCSDEDALNDHGILSGAQRAAMKAHAMQTVVLPAARRLLESESRRAA
jgi:hypothetical protein